MADFWGNLGQGVSDVGKGMFYRSNIGQGIQAFQNQMQINDALKKKRVEQYQNIPNQWLGGDAQGSPMGFYQPNPAQESAKAATLSSALAQQPQMPQKEKGGGAETIAKIVMMMMGGV